jgi:hypothetical protein
MSAIKSFAGQSYLEGLQGPLEAFNDPEQNLEKYIASVTSSAVPNAVRSLARAGDSIERDARGVVKGVKSAIPGLRQTLPEKQDLFGLPIPAKDTPANQFLNPLKPSRVRGDATTTELRRLYNGEEGILPTKAKTDAFKGMKLTRDQTQAIDRIAGPAMKEAYDKVIASDNYKALDDEQKRKALGKVNETIFGALKQQYADENGIQTDGKLSTNQKRYINGKSVNYTAGEDGPDYAEKYESLLDDFKKDNGKWSSVEKIKKQNELEKLSVQKDYDKDTVDLYSLAKDDVYTHLTSDPNGKSKAEKLLAYGDAMEKKTGTKNKFRDSKGGEAFQPKAKSASGGSSSTRKGFQAPKGSLKALLEGTIKDAADTRSILKNAKVSVRRA